MAKQRQPFVTGDRELDHILRTFTEKEVRKAVRKATRKGCKRVLAAYRQKIEQEGFVETGALRDVPKMRAVKRSRKHFGHEVYIDRHKLNATRSERGGRIGWDKKRKEPFFYFAAIEFGGVSTSGLAPLRKSLHENSERALHEFREDLRIALVTVASRAKLKAAAKAS